MENKWIGNTCDIELTSSQEKALEYAIGYIRDLHAYDKYDKYEKGGSRFSSYGFKNFKIRKCSYGDVQISLEIHNGKPGTIGYEIPEHCSFFIGKRGKIYAYKSVILKNGKRKLRTYTGNKALIYCS